MEKNKELLQESIDKIKGMMYYDSEKTLIENEIDEGPRGDQRRADKTARKATAQTNRDSGMSNKDARQIKKATRQDQSTARKETDWDTTKQEGEPEATDADLDNSTYEEDFEANELKNINRFVRRIHRKAQDLDKYYGKLNSSTHNGVSALDAVKAAYQEKYGEALPNWGGSENVAPAKSTYKAQFPPCQGGINKLGCKSNSIVLVQDMLKGIKVDGMFGPETQKRISRVAPEFSKQFTDADVPAIREKLKMDAEHGVTHPVPGEARPEARKISGKSFPSPVDPMAGFKPDKINPSEVAEGGKGGYTNMAQGFVNESTMSQKEIKRRNKEDRLNKKLGRV